jgi:hypothetical protein
MNPGHMPKSDPAIPSLAKNHSDRSGSRKMFAIVNGSGKLQRGMHAASAKRLDVGVYEVLFRQDIGQAVYLATPGGQGDQGIPVPAVISVVPGINPRSVLVYTTNPQGDPLAVGFQVLVVFPDGDE